MRPALIVSYLILDYFISTEYINFADKPGSAWAAADTECVCVSLPAPPWPPAVLMSQAHRAGKARGFFPFHLALPDAIPQLHTSPTELITDYLRFSPNANLEFVTQLSYVQLCSKAAPSSILLSPESAGWQSSLLFWYSNEKNGPEELERGEL